MSLSRFLPQRCLASLYRTASRSPINQSRYNSSSSTHSNASITLAETDDCGIPLNPTWSVHDLLNSYPKPKLSSETLKKLHRLSALTPPEEGTPEHAKLTSELEDLIKLVEAVRLVDCSELKSEDDSKIPDGRILPRGVGIDLSGIGIEEVKDGGRELLKHAARTQDGFYVVDADRRLPR